MSEQLCLFPVSSDNAKVSLPESSSDAKRQAIQRFLNNGKREPTACINKYRPNRRKTEYYRLSFNWHGKKKHVHIPGGNVNSKLANYRAEKLQIMIDRSADISELLALINDYGNGNV